VIVRCPNCGTEFGFDDRQVGEGLTVRCSVCKHVFKVSAAASPAAPPPSPAWQIRTTDDTSFTAPDVATLREWISEGRLTPDDQVSRTGRSWMRLGEMPELADLFSRQEGGGGIPGVVKPVPPVRPPVVAQPPRPAVSPPPSSAVPPVIAPVVPTGSPGSANPSPQATAPIVRPIVRPQASASVAADPAVLDDDEDEQDEQEDQLAADDDDDVDDDDDDDDDDVVDVDDSRRPDRHAAEDSFEAPTPRRGGLGVIAAIAVIVMVGVGVVFGVPSIREKVLGGASPDAPADSEAGAAATRPEITAADVATNSLGTVALAEAEAGLQRAIDARDADSATQAALEFALAELLLNRALAYQIAAAIDEDRREDFRARATDDRLDGERLIDRIEGFSDVDRLAEARALARLAAGRAEVEVAPLVPANASETKLIVRGAVLWQDPAASVPEGLVAGLQVLPQRSGLGQSVLALALLRAGDTTEARNTAERLMVGVGTDEQVVAQAIRTKLGPDQAAAPEVGATGGAEAGAEVAAEGGAEAGTIAKPPPPPGGDGGEGGGGASEGGGGGSFERLLERGCEQVATGDADAGIKTLQRAFDKNPRDVDVLVCLADGYAAQGSNHHANQFYERALAQSPNNKGALRGAAKAAAKTGATQKAIGLYERLLKVDPNNAVALAYIANNKPGGAPPPSEPEPAPAPEAGG
jgi:predicted Zn finger-like uncharacterized protein